MVLTGARRFREPMVLRRATSKNRASGYPTTLEAAERLWHGHDTGHAETNGLLALRFGRRRGLHRERQLREAHVEMRLVHSEPVVADDSVHH